MRRFFTRFCFLVICVLGLHAPVSADDEWQAQVVRQLRTNLRYVENNTDYVPSHEAMFGTLYRNTYWDITYRLERGIPYVMTAACDNDCEDIDLNLYDENGRPIDSDTKPDDHPVVGVTPLRDATFTLRVTMVRCAHGPCRYGTQAFWQK